MQLTGRFYFREAGCFLRQPHLGSRWNAHRAGQALRCRERKAERFARYRGPRLPVTVIITKYFDAWNGTEWDFNGTTRTPKKGKIACGYFITTVLYDAGLDIPRVKWAQQASEYFITRLSIDVKRFFSNKPIGDVIHYIDSKSDGLYIAGMDSHVGFIYKKGRKMKFVHASYYDPKVGVQAEDLDSNNPLNASKYRVIGRLLDDVMMKKWLLNEQWE